MANIKVGDQAGPTHILLAQPVVVVGANTDGCPDFATAIFVGVAAGFPPSITIGLQPQRHSLKGIRQNMTFSINIPSADNIRETDYCGLVSGSMTDKVTDCGFRVYYGSIATAPLIEQFPVCHACEVQQLMSLGSHVLVVGKVVETYYNDQYVTEGKLDINKVKPVVFAQRGYYGLG